MLTTDQLRDLARQTARNAADLVSDARFLLDAGRIPRAYALAVLALEEVGKIELCHAAMTGSIDERSLRSEWRDHISKLARSSLMAILLADTERRIFAVIGEDSDMKFRGLYVDLPRASGASRTPSELPADATRELVEVVEKVVQQYGPGDWATGVDPYTD